MPQGTLRTASIISRLSLGAVLAASPASGSAQPAAPTLPASGEIRVVPAAPVQGDTVTLTIPAPAQAEVTAQFDATAIPVFAAQGEARRALIGTSPDVASGTHTVTVSIRDKGGGWRRLVRSVRIGAGHFGVRRLTLPPSTIGLITPENLAIEARALRAVLGRRTPVALWQGPFQAPSAGLLDSPYGQESVYNGHREWWHQGMDYSDAEGSPIVAANTGVVALAQVLPLGGGTVVIDHGQGVLTEYLHLSAFTVHVGDRVARGGVIGRMGATGLVTGPSVHWGLYVNGIPVNPLFWMEPRPGLTG